MKCLLIILRYIRYFIFINLVGVLFLKSKLRDLLKVTTTSITATTTSTSQPRYLQNPPTFYFYFFPSLILTHKRTITTAIHHRTQWLNHQSPPNFTPKPSDHHSNTISYQKIMADPQQSTLYMAPKTGRNKTAPSLNHGKTN